MAFVLYNAPTVLFPLQWEFAQCLQQLSAQDLAKKVLFVLPTKRLVRYHFRKFIRQYFSVHRRAVDVCPFLTIDQVAMTILRRLTQQVQIRRVSDAYLTVLLQEAIQQTQTEYYTFENTLRTPGILERIYEILQGLKEDGIQPQHLLQQLENPEAFRILSIPRFRDLARIYQTYEKLLGGTLLDPAGQVQRAVEFLRGEWDVQTLERVLIPDNRPETIQQRWKTVFPELEAIIFAGFSDFRKPEQELLELLQNSPFHVRILLDFSPRNGPLFGKFQTIITDLQNRGYKSFRSEEEREQLPPEQWPRHAYLRRWLFNTEKALHHIGFTPIVSVFGVEDRVAEVHLIGKKIQQLVAEEKIPYSQIAIVSRIPEIYAGLFREIFPLYRIPMNVTARFVLQESPVIAAIFSILDLILHGFRRRDLHRALSSPYLQLYSLEHQKGIDPAVLTAVASRYRIHGGYRYGGLHGWFQRLQQRRNFLQQYREDYQQKPYADPDVIAELTQQIRQLEQAEKTLQHLTELHFSIQPAEHLTAAEFVHFLKKEIFEHFRIAESIWLFYKRIRELPKETLVEAISLLEEAEKDARAFTRFHEILEEMVFIESELYDLPKRRFDEFVQKLRTAIFHARYQVREKFGYGVTITSLEEIRGIPFHAIFLCGAIEKELPLAYVPETFLGQELPESEEHHLQQERILFYQVLTNNPGALEDGSFRLIITYPRFQESQELVRSSFLDALLKITTIEHDGKVFDLPEMKKQLVIPTKREEAERRFQQLPFLSTCYSVLEVLQELGKAEATGAGKEAEQLLSILPEQERPIGETILHFVRTYHHFQQKRQKVQLKTAQSRQLLQKVIDQPISVSFLEQYRSCPYQFFAERILRLQPLIKPEITLTPLEQGVLLHTILFRFFSELLQKHDRNPATELRTIEWDPTRITEYRQLLHSIGMEEFRRITFDYPFRSVDQVRLLGSHTQKGVLDRWLEEEISLHTEGNYRYTPALFEESFGRPGRSSSPPVEITEKLKLQGKIDRIDIRSPDPSTIEFFIIDYKSSKAGIPRKSALLKGEAFQMPLYLVAAQQILQQRLQKTAEPKGALYIVLLPPPEKNRDTSALQHHYAVIDDEGIFLSTKKSAPTSQIIKRTIKRAETILEQILAGHFAVRPENARICQRCPYSSVCRIRELQYQTESD